MKRFVLYVNVLNMPRSQTPQYMSDLVANLRDSGVIDPTDRIAAMSVEVGDTRLELISDDYVMIL